jgi:cation:H+ antiporter
LILLKISKNQKENTDSEAIDKNYVKNFALIIIGLGMLVLGSDWLITTVVMLAKYLGVSELVISLTIVSAGTSLPEVVTSLVASFKGERDIAVGNIVGSNIFNILSVLGLTALCTPNGIPVNSSMISFDLPVMIAVSLSCILIFMIRRGITRLEGALLFLYYIIYTGFLILIATENTINVMLVELLIYFVALITVVSLLVIFNIKRETSNS